jgi:glycosyltransferase involved in cell wall biosynthesis
MSKPCRVLHIVDTLEPGGQERVVVNLVNHLPRERCQAFLCTTRKNGPLAEKVAPDVIALQLKRRHRFEVRPLRRLVAFIREHDIQILHAHGSSLFLAIVAALFAPFPLVVLHLHTGRLTTDKGKTRLYRIVASRINGIIAVNQALADWSCQKIHVAPNKVWYVPNFVWSDNGIKKKEKIILPGQAGGRIVCLANLRPLKDHITLLHAMVLVTQQMSHAHLILVGSASDTVYLEVIQKLISKSELEKHVSLLGQKNDVLNILELCDVGILSSISEGFPMTLLEYGMAGLPTVATQVGQCPELLDYGRAGILVTPGSPDQLAEAILGLLRSPDRRSFLGKQLNLHVQKCYNQHRILEKFCLFYEMILGDSQNAAPSPARR